MGETKARLYKRSTADKKIEELLNRVDKLNSEAEHSEYLYYVKELVIFGSYVNTDNEKIHDLDIGFLFEIKPRYYKNDCARNNCYNRAPSNLSYLDRTIHWPTEEVLRYLKCGSPIYSFHPIDFESNIIKGKKYKTIVKDRIILR